MRFRSILLAAALFFSCATHRYDPNKFQIHFVPPQGIQSAVATVNVAYHFRVLLTGPIPTVPLCRVILVDGLENQPIILQESCGFMAESRMFNGVHVFSVADYMLTKPPPWRQPMAGEYEQEVIGGAFGADENMEPQLAFIMEFYYAEPDETGILKRGKFITRARSRPFRLDCRSCAW